jgi:hypothetical protein
MKILYLDFLYPKGHVRQNSYYINILSQIADVYVLSPKGRYTNLSSKVKVIENKALKIKNGRFSNRVSSLKIMIISAIIAHKLKPDYVFVSTYETIMFARGRFFFQKYDRLFLMQHFNIDELKNGFKCRFFKTYMRKVNHIVFENFIKDYLIETFNLDENRIHVLPHQLNQNSPKINQKKYRCVGLSFSNDENLISEIVYKEKKEELFKNAKCRVILKSKVTEFDNGYLKVIKGYLEDDLYNEYIDNCLCIYMPFPLSYKYRMSGTLVDALSNNKILLGSDIPVLQYYSSKYPSVCKVIKSVEDFFAHVLAIENDLNEEQIKDFEQFRKDHSVEKIKSALGKMFHIG